MATLPKLKKLKTLSAPKSTMGMKALKARTAPKVSVSALSDLEAQQYKQNKLKQTAKEYGTTLDKASDDRNAVEKALGLGQGQGFFGDLFEVLGKPMETVEGTLVDGFKGGIAGLTGTKHYSGQDILKEAGIINDDSPQWFKSLGGFATDIALDPLSWSNKPFELAGKGIKAAVKPGLKMATNALSKSKAGSEFLEKISGAYDKVHSVFQSAVGTYKNEAFRANKNAAGNRANHMATTMEGSAHILTDIKAESQKFVDHVHANQAEFKEVLSKHGVRTDGKATREEVEDAVNKETMNAMEQERKTNLSKADIYNKIGEASDEEGRGRFLISGDNAEQQAKSIMDEIKADWKKANGRPLGSDDLSFTNGFVNVSPEVATFLRRETKGMSRVSDRLDLMGVDGRAESAIQTLAKSGEVTLHLEDQSEREIYDLLNREFKGKMNAEVGANTATIALTKQELTQFLSADSGEAVKQILQESRDYSSSATRLDQVNEEQTKLMKRLQELSKQKGERDAVVNQIYKKTEELQVEGDKIAAQQDGLVQEINAITEDLKKNKAIIAQVKKQKFNLNDGRDAAAMFDTVYNHILEQMPGLKNVLSDEQLNDMVNRFKKMHGNTSQSRMGTMTVTNPRRGFGRSTHGTLSLKGQTWTDADIAAMQPELTIYHEIAHAIDNTLFGATTKETLTSTMMHSTDKEFMTDVLGGVFDEAKEGEFDNLKRSLRRSNYRLMNDVMKGKKDAAEIPWSWFKKNLKKFDLPNESSVAQTLGDAVRAYIPSISVMRDPSEMFAEIMAFRLQGAAERSTVFDKPLDNLLKKAKVSIKKDFEPLDIVKSNKEKELASKFDSISHIEVEKNELEAKLTGYQNDIDAQLAKVEGTHLSTLDRQMELQNKISRQDKTINKISKETDMEFPAEATNEDVADQMIKPAEKKVTMVGDPAAQQEAQKLSAEINRVKEWNDKDFYQVKMAESVLLEVNGDFKRIINSMEAFKQKIYQDIRDVSAPSGSTLSDVLDVLNVDGYMRHVINHDALVYKEINRLKKTGTFTEKKARQLTAKLGDNATIFQQKWLGSAVDINEKLGVELFSSDPIESLAVMLKLVPEHFEASNLFQAAFEDGLIRGITKEEGLSIVDETQNFMREGFHANAAKAAAAKKALPKEFTMVTGNIKKRLLDSFEFLRAGGATGPELQQLIASIDKIENGESLIMHKGMLDQLVRYGSRIKNSDLKHIMDTLRKYVVNPFKSVATFSAGFHLRNNVTNVTNAYLAGIKPIEYTTHFAQAGRDVTKIERQILPKIKKIMTSGEDITRTVEGQMSMIRNSLTSEEYQLMNKMMEWQSKGVLGVNRFTGDLADIMNHVNKVRKPGIVEGGKKVLEASMKLGKLSDDASKIAAYEFAKNTANGAKLMAKHGFTQPEQLSKFIFFDYTDLTAFEQSYMKSIFPFYTWTRKNIEFQIKNFMLNSHKYVRMNHAIQSWQNFMAGGDIDNMSSYEVENMNIPVWNSNGKITTLKVAPGFLDLTENPLNKLSPIIKAPLESLSGHNFFSDADASANPITQLSHELLGNFGEIGKMIGGKPFDSTQTGLIGGKVAGIQSALQAATQGDVAGMIPSGFRETEEDTNKANNIKRRNYVAQGYLQALQKAGASKNPNLVPRSRSRAATSGSSYSRSGKFNI